jgi:hypothetical protein
LWGKQNLGDSFYSVESDEKRNGTGACEKKSEEKRKYLWYQPVWRIQDVYPGFRIRLFSIPDPGSELSPSRIPDPNCLHPGSRILKEFKYFNPKKSKKNGF